MLQTIQLFFLQRYCPIKILSIEQFKAILNTSHVINYDKQGYPKTIKTQDNFILKLVSQSDLSRLLKLVRIADKLKRKHIRVLEIEYMIHCSEMKRWAAAYPYYAGHTLSEQVEAGNLNCLTQFANYLAELHRKHLYFRGGHLANILLEENGQFRLIDMANLRFSISLRRRARNIAFIIYHYTGREAFQKYGVEKFINVYLSHAKLNKLQVFIFRKIFHYYARKFMIN